MYLWVTLTIVNLFADKTLFELVSFLKLIMCLHVLIKDKKKLVLYIFIMLYLHLSKVYYLSVIFLNGMTMGGSTSVVGVSLAQKKN